MTGMAPRIVMALTGQTVTQMPQPRHRGVSTRKRVFG